jgi:integrase
MTNPIWRVRSAHARGLAAADEPGRPRPGRRRRKGVLGCSLALPVCRDGAVQARATPAWVGVAGAGRIGALAQATRLVPLSTSASAALARLARLASRDDFLQPDDGVLVNRFGRHLEGSAFRRRYKRACAAAGLRPVRLHGLRHAAGSLIARTSDPVFVRDFLGHAKLSTTDRYLSAKLRPEELKRLDDAFAPVPVPDGAESGLGSH